MTAPAAARKRYKRLFFQGLSWCVVAGIFLYVLASIVPAEEAQSLTVFARLQRSIAILVQAWANANLPAIAALTIGYMIFLVLIDSAGTRWVIQRFNCPITMKEMIPARAITFLIAVLNYQAGQVALPIYLKRTHKVPVLEGSSSIAFIALTDMFIVFGMATVGALFMTEANLSKQILSVGLIGVGVYVANAVFWHAPALSKPFFAALRHIPFLKRLDPERSVFVCFRQAGVKDYVTIFFFRLPIHLAILACLYLMIRFFHEEVPFRAILVYTPVVMVISNIPVINVGAVGAAQASTIYFFKQYAPEAVLVAVSLTWAFALNGLKILLGGIYLNRHSAKLFQPEPEEEV